MMQQRAKSMEVPPAPMPALRSVLNDLYCHVDGQLELHGMTAFLGPRTAWLPSSDHSHSRPDVLRIRKIEQDGHQLHPDSQARRSGWSHRGAYSLNRTGTSPAETGDHQGSWWQRGVRAGRRRCRRKRVEVRVAFVIRSTDCKIPFHLAGKLLRCSTRSFADD